MALRHGECECVREDRLSRRLVTDGVQALTEQDPWHHPVRLRRDGETEVLDGPGGVAFVVQATTDNKTRAAKDIRAAFARHDGNLASTGAVSFQFLHAGQFLIPREAAAEEALLELAGLVAMVQFSLTRLVRSNDRREVIEGLKQRWQSFRGRG